MAQTRSFPVLISSEALQRRIKELGEEISRDYDAKPLTLIALLNGSIFFLTDLIRSLKIADLHIECWRVWSYLETRSSGAVMGLESCKAEIDGRHALIVDDIYDTGLTLSRVQDHVKKFSPVSIRTCVLLEKETRHEVAVSVEYIGFSIPDEFVVGYGLDYNGRYRELPEIRIFQQQYS